jgi:hypothetical protein
MAEDEELPDMASLEINSSEDVFSSPKQLEGDLVTLTLLPRSRWQSLLHLDVIQVRSSSPFGKSSSLIPSSYHRRETNRKKLRRLPRRRRFSCQPYLVLNTGSIRLNNKIRQRSHLRERRRKWEMSSPMLEVIYRSSYPRKLRTGIVSYSFPNILELTQF